VITPGSTNPAHSPGSSKGLGGGPVAGVAIGCLIAGVLIGAFVFFLCTRFRRRNAALGEKGVVANVNHSGIAAYNTGGKGVGVSAMQLQLDSAGAIVESNTKDPVADADLKAEFSQINDRINNHVHSYFGLGSGQTGQVDNQAVAAAVARLPGGGVGLSEAQIAALLASQKGRPEILRAIIARILVTRMGIDASPDVTLLPPSVAATLHSMPYIIHTDSGTWSRFKPNVQKLTNFNSENGLPDQVAGHHSPAAQRPGREREPDRRG
jgi:hypothetical protein